MTKGRSDAVIADRDLHLPYPGDRWRWRLSEEPLLTVPCLHLERATWRARFWHADGTSLVVCREDGTFDDGLIQRTAIRLLVDRDRLAHNEAELDRLFGAQE